MIIQIHNGRAVVFTAEPEDTPIGDWLDCPKEKAKLKRQVKAGTLQHFCLKLALYDDEGNEIADQYLGECYYKNLKDCIDNSGYTPQLIEELFDQLEA